MDEEVKQLFFKLLQEHKDKITELVTDDSDSDSDTASVRSATCSRSQRTNRYTDGASSSKPTGQDWNLMRELECPVCKDMMIPPILMCHNGHNICSNCRPKLKKCPLCKKSFLKVRNLALETVIRKMGSPCRYAKYGCEQSLPPGVVEQHQNSCAYRPFLCPLSHAERIKCRWNDAYSKLEDHIESTHQDRLTRIDEEKKVIMKRFIPLRKYSRIIFACDEIFYQQFQVIDDVFYFAIQHVGSETCPRKYRYTFTLALEKNIELIQMAFIARSYNVDIRDVYRSGQCVKLHYNTVKNFMEPNETLVFHFHVTNATYKK